jgi:hypothetical protein
VVFWDSLRTIVSQRWELRGGFVDGHRFGRIRAYLSCQIHFSVRVVQVFESTEAVKTLDISSCERRKYLTRHGRIRSRQPLKAEKGATVKNCPPPQRLHPAMLSPFNAGKHLTFDVFPKAPAKSLTQYLSATSTEQVNCLLLASRDPGDILYTIHCETPCKSQQSYKTDAVGVDRRLDMTCCSSEAANIGIFHISAGLYFSQPERCCCSPF